MKKIFRTLLSILFAMSMTAPASTLAATVQEFEETVDKREINSDCDDYNLTFLQADLNLTLNRTGLSDHAGSLVVFITNPDGKIVKNAQVITTIIGSGGVQVMDRAQSLKGGYLINTASLSPGEYHLEAEIITKGLLLTDEFSFQHV